MLSDLPTRRGEYLISSSDGNISVQAGVFRERGMITRATDLLPDYLSIGYAGWVFTRIVSRYS